MNLLFRVRNQQIERLESNLVVSGSKNYLYAKFTFTKEWNGLTKTAVFKREEDEEGYLVVLNNDVALIPWEVLQNEGIFYVSVFGGDLITVNKARVVVEESGYVDGGQPSDPTPDVYTQLTTHIDTKQDKLTAGYGIDITSDSVISSTIKKVSQLENDSKYATEEALAAKQNVLTAGRGIIIDEETCLISVDNSEITKEDFDKLSSEVAKNASDIVALENDEHDLGNQVSHLQSDFNLLKTQAITEDSESTLSNKTIKGELRVNGNNAGETFNISFAAGTATIATNNGLDLLSDTQFAKVPTIEKDEAISEVAENGFVTKKQLLAQIAILQAQIEALK